MSTVNWSEVVQRLPDLRSHPELLKAQVTFEPLTTEDAETAARLRAATRAAGLSLADRCCLALALRLDRPVLTADRAWSEIESGVDVRLIR